MRGSGNSRPGHIGMGLAAAAFAAVLGAVAAAAAPPLAPATGQSAAAPTVFDYGASFDVNEILCPVTNYGVLARDYSQEMGLQWPQGAGSRVVHAAGLWLVSFIFGTPRSAVADYGSEFTPGPMTGGGDASDPFGANPNYRVYKIGISDLTNPGSDYLNWPPSQGAPFDSLGNPILYGDQTLFSVFNDAYTPGHSLLHGSTLPLQAEVHQTVYGLNRPASLSRIMVVHYTIKNRARFRWPEFYVGIWMDPDLGEARDDLCGYDSTLSVGFAYDTPAEFGGPVEPAVGVCLLGDTLLDRPQVGVRAFAAYPREEDPASYVGTLNLVRGLQANGDPWDCGGPFAYPGDPVAGTGCLDTQPGDKRLVLSIGPFDMNPNAQVDVDVAFVVGNDARSARSADNVGSLRQTVEAVRAAWKDGFLSVPAVPSEVRLGSVYPNPSRDVTEFDLELPEGATASTVEIVDLRGRVIWRQPAQPSRPGFNHLIWSGQTFFGPPASQGVYWLRVLTDRGVFLRKLVRLR